jgi:hypothetical protein
MHLFSDVTEKYSLSLWTYFDSVVIAICFRFLV